MVGGRETNGDEVFLIHSVLLRALPYEAVEYAVKSTHSRCVGNRVRFFQAHRRREGFLRASPDATVAPSSMFVLEVDSIRGQSHGAEIVYRQAQGADHGQARQR